MSEKPAEPCPFCGGEAKLYEVTDPEDYRTIYKASCSKCGASTMRSQNKKTAAWWWNMRTNERRP